MPLAQIEVSTDNTRVRVTVNHQTWVPYMKRTDLLFKCTKIALKHTTKHILLHVCVQQDLELSENIAGKPLRSGLTEWGNKGVFG